MKKILMILVAATTVLSVWSKPVKENTARKYAKQIQFAIENNIEPTQEVQQQWAQYLGNNNNGKEE